MREIKGDFWAEFDKNPYDAAVCTINNVIKNDARLVMGKGIALSFDRRYPWLALEWANRIKKFGSQLLISSYHNVSGPPYYLIGLPTKLHWKDSSPLWLIEQSINELVQAINFLDLRKVLMTRPGCGNGGWDWDDLCQGLKLERILDDRFFVINKD